jgi:hypothetical protein
LVYWPKIANMEPKKAGKLTEQADNKGFRPEIGFWGVSTTDGHGLAMDLFGMPPRAMTAQFSNSP